MLYGPPGTGKTWLAAREAVRAIEPSQYSAALSSPAPDEALQALHRSLVNEGRILWVTFHPNYSYEDFVEGYRPVVNGLVMTYQVVDGPFKLLCEKVRRKEDLEVGEQLRDSGGGEAGEVMEVDADGWVVRVRPGRSDQIAEYTDKVVPRKLIQRLLDKGMQPNIFSVPGSGENTYPVARYGLDPGDPDVVAQLNHPGETVLTGPKLKRVLAAKTGMLNSVDLGNNAVYGAVMRRLIEIRGTSSPSKPVALVIDEFNRADASRVFGELLTLLETDKREGMPEERRVMLPYSQTRFAVPPQLSVIGTMNTVDKSLAPVDFAMRRRFRFEYVGAAEDLLSNAYGGVDLPCLLRRVNGRLASVLGTGYEIGHAFLMSDRLDEIAEQWGWASGDAQLRALAHVLRTSIVPTVVEYFHEDWRKVRAVLGQTIVDGQEVSLFEVPPEESKFLERLPEDYELVDGRVAYFSPWWDPTHDAWDPSRVASFLSALARGD